MLVVMGRCRKAKMKMGSSGFSGIEEEGCGNCGRWRCEIGKILCVSQ